MDGVYLIYPLHIKDNKIQIHLLEEALNIWSSVNVYFPTYKSLQKEWDVINIKRIIETSIHFVRATDLASFKALQLLESGTWLQVVPSKNIDTFIDSQIFQICVGLRLGCNLYQSHICTCGNFVNETGIHGLSCSKSKGRFLRHSDLNNIIQRALSSAHIHSTQEPTGLSRDDGKRPDGATLTHWSKGQRLIWDVTCVDTLATSYLPQTTIEAGSAAEIACKKKHEKYKKLIISSGFNFKALAFETLGRWCDEAESFIDAIGTKLFLATGNSKARYYLKQRISLALQRGNGASILGRLPNSPILEDIFLL
jgi:hypothetical protein